MEHIYNLPGVIYQVMNTVKAGGNYIGMSPTDGWCGHGFCQISPDFVNKTCSRENGYDRLAVMTTCGIRKQWYSVADQDVWSHASIRFGRPTMLYWCARRIQDDQVPCSAPTQGYYDTSRPNGERMTVVSSERRALARSIYALCIGLLPSCLNERIDIRRAKLRRERGFGKPDLERRLAPSGR